MDTRQLEYILTIAEEKNLSRAAERLFLSQSALSQQLQKLADEGLPSLFVRQKGCMQLTDAGRIYVNGARTIQKINQDALRALDELKQNHSATVKIAVSPHLQQLYYTRVIPWIKHMFPDILVTTVTVSPWHLKNNLDKGTLDLAIVSSSLTISQGFTSIPLIEDELVLASLPSLAGIVLPMALPPKDTCLRIMFDHSMEHTDLKFSVYAEPNDISSALALAACGECAAVVPRSSLNETPLSCSSFQPAIPFTTSVIFRDSRLSFELEQLSRHLKSIFKDSPTDLPGQ